MPVPLTPFVSVADLILLRVDAPSPATSESPMSAISTALSVVAIRMSPGPSARAESRLAKLACSTLAPLTFTSWPPHAAPNDDAATSAATTLLRARMDMRLITSRVFRLFQLEVQGAHGKLRLETKQRPRAVVRKPYLGLAMF